MKWQRDTDGDYTLSLADGRSAWIAKETAGKNHPTWYGRITNPDGSYVRISAWSLRYAKRQAENALGVNQ